MVFLILTLINSLLLAISLWLTREDEKRMDNLGKEQQCIRTEMVENYKSTREWVIDGFEKLKEEFSKPKAKHVRPVIPDTIMKNNEEWVTSKKAHELFNIPISSLYYERKRGHIATFFKKHIAYLNKKDVKAIAKKR